VDIGISRAWAAPLVAPLLFLLGCATAPAAPPGAARVVRTSEFVIYQGDSLVASEQAAEYTDRIEGSIEVVGRARAHYTAWVGEAYTVRRIEAQVLPWRGGSMGNAVNVDFVGDSVLVERTLPLPSLQRRGGGAALPYLHPSPVLLERVVFRALQQGVNPADVRLWLATNNAAITARVTFVSARVADVQMGQTEMRVWLDDFGLVMAEVPSLGWLIQRRAR